MRRAPASVIALPLLVAAALASAGCGKKKAAAPPPAKAPAVAPTIQPKKEVPPPPLTGSQRVQIEADFAEARKLADEARVLRLKGEQLEKDKGREAANDTFVAARRTYQKAVQMTEKWVEPDAGQEVTQRQVDLLAELRPYVDQRGSWIKEIASMGVKLNVR